MIWLVDYTQYSVEVDPELQSIRNDFYRIKSHVRMERIGPTAPPATKMFSNGLLRIATILAGNDMEVRYFFAEDFIRELQNGSTMPEKVAFSVVCPTLPKAAALSAVIKKRYPYTITYVGGVHINICAETTRLRYPVFDQYVTGYEYEAAQKIAGRILKNRGGSYLNFSLLPHPLSHYGINAISTVGCPFHCEYCVDGRAPHFTASPDGMIREMIPLLPGKKTIHFCDSVLGGSQAGIMKVCDALIEDQHDFLLSCDMRIDLLTPQIIEKLQKAGFVEIRVGLESADSSVLKRNQRTLSYEKFLKQAEMVRNYSDLYVSAYSILGIPGTTIENTRYTWEQFEDLLSNGLVDEIKNTLYVPYPMDGVDYNQRHIYIDTDDWEKYDRWSYPVYHTDDLSGDEIWNLYLKTSRKISDAWLKAAGYHSYDEVPLHEGYYSEYMQTNYLLSDSARRENNG